MFSTAAEERNVVGGGVIGGLLPCPPGRFRGVVRCCAVDEGGNRAKGGHCKE